MSMLPGTRGSGGSGSRARRGLVVSVLGVALAAGALGGVAGPTTAHAAITTYYFHGTATDDANRAQVLAGNAQPSATFDTTAPASSLPAGFTQTGSPPANKDDAGNALAVYWYAPFTGTVNGSLAFDWWWSSSNATAVALGSPMTVTVFADPTLEQVGQTEIAQTTITLNVGPTPTENKNVIPLKPACPCTVTSHLLIQVSTNTPDTGHGVTAHYDSTAVASQFSVATGTSTPAPTPAPTASPTAGPVQGQGGPQAFRNYQSPYPYPHNPPPPSAVALLFGEPSIGVDWATNNTMYQGDLNTWQVHFDYSVKPPVATWNDRSDVATDTSSLDPRLITDHAGLATDRTIVEQLHLATSTQAYTDTDGGSAPPPANSADWVSGSSGLNGGVDHQSIGAGRYSVYTAAPSPAPTYPHAVYYCAQDTAMNAYCTRSDNGGLTYGAPSIIFSSTNCGSHIIHGKPRVGPDGVVYVPNADCGGQKAISISKDNGQTFTVVKIPGTSTDSNQFDPDLAVGGVTGMGTIYYAYRDGDHHAKVVTSTDDGSTWSTPIDLGSYFGLQNIQFPAVAAGDQNRAAVSFLGTGVAGDDLPDGFSDQNGAPAIWYMYTAYTYDGGQSWQVVNALPNDPVQRGGICAGGTGCTGNDRNMLDFNDATIDNQGRFQIAYTDGCTGACESNSSAPSCSVGSQNCMGKFSSVFSMVNQVCGRGLFAKYDPGFFNDPSCPTAPAINTPEAPVASVLVLTGGAVGLAVFVGIRRRRRGTALPA